MGVRLDRLFVRYGCRAKLGSTWVQVLFQPPCKKKQQAYTPLGAVSPEDHVCYFPASCPVYAGDTLELLGQAYYICQADSVAGLRGQPLYQRAFCRKKGGDAL